VRDKRDILDYAECIGNGRLYEPPVSFHGLAKSLRSAVHHSSPIYVKRNILASTFIPHPIMSQQEFNESMKRMQDNASRACIALMNLASNNATLHLFSERDLDR